MDRQRVSRGSLSIAGVWGATAVEKRGWKAYRIDGLAVGRQRAVVGERRHWHVGRGRGVQPFVAGASTTTLVGVSWVVDVQLMMTSPDMVGLPEREWELRRRRPLPCARNVMAMCRVRW